MDIISNRTKDIAHLALDGLYARQKAIGSNTANVLTPNYQRKEVSFESNLRNVIERENEKENIKIENSNLYKQNPTQLLKSQDPARLAFLNSNTKDGFSVDIEVDTSDPLGLDNNNVNIEEEMMGEAKTAMQYQTVASLLSKSYTQLEQVIKGQN